MAKGAKKVARLFKRRVKLARNIIADNQGFIWTAFEEFYQQANFIEEHILTGATKIALTSRDGKGNIHFVFKEGNTGGYVWGARTPGARYNPGIFLPPAENVQDLLYDNMKKATAALVKGKKR